MNKYEQFDTSMLRLKKIESELNELNNKDDISLNKVMELREEGIKHYKICNETLKELKENSKQPIE